MRIKISELRRIIREAVRSETLLREVELEEVEVDLNDDGENDIEINTIGKAKEAGEAKAQDMR
tara:strand:- start:328 stop:516 length:189 start_codon:yes stop_codon:yes gene_type:complete